MQNNSSLEKHGPPFIPALRSRFASKESSGRGLPGGIVYLVNHFIKGL